MMHFIQGALNLPNKETLMCLAVTYISYDKGFLIGGANKKQIP